MLETQIQTSRDYDREGQDNLIVGLRAGLDGVQKGIDAAGLGKNFNIDTKLGELGGIIDDFISPSPKQE
jgi:hypothetical protein